jgi:hypothetical protein
MAVFWVVAPCSLVKVYRRFSCACCLHHQGVIVLLMEAASTSEMSVNFCQTARCNNPEYSHLYTRRRENLKSDKVPKVKHGLFEEEERAQCSP